MGAEGTEGCVTFKGKRGEGGGKGSGEEGDKGEREGEHRGGGGPQCVSALEHSFTTFTRGVPPHTA